MRAKMGYQKRIYGNEENARQYTVTITRSPTSGTVDIQFDFGQPPLGRSLSHDRPVEVLPEGASFLKWVKLTVPDDTARQLADALVNGLNQSEKSKVTLPIKE